MGQLALAEGLDRRSPADLLAMMERRLLDLERAERHLAAATESVAAASELVRLARAGFTEAHAELAEGTLTC